MCPGMDCEDLVPEELSVQLRTVLTCHVHLSQENKSNVRLATDICIVIKCEHKRLEYIKLAAEKNWPTTTIDFQGILNRILEMYDELKEIMFVREVRENLFLWNCFEANLEVDGWSTSRFAQMQPSDITLTSEVWRNSRGGYYGSKGTAIVLHTLSQLFPLRNTTTDAFHPLPILHYLSYFIVPHVISRLIAQDCKKTTDISAYGIMVASSDAGEHINPDRDDDPEIDMINHKTTIALKRAAVDRQQDSEDLETVAAKALVCLRRGGEVDKPDEPKSRPRPRLVMRPPKPPVDQAEDNSSREKYLTR
ncbi:hypothetical protein J3R83DRAFT_11684 [Lanmaoa asiatica]|nr:hypothetical protein J3R83DRAFT_5831 [Lanmaoa asiatica]KAH0834309.1 hypothetical protein J3R83DRAFT_11684 [Lanmaoa asiatica]